jgi:hypothetical protein
VPRRHHGIGAGPSPRGGLAHAVGRGRGRGERSARHPERLAGVRTSVSTGTSGGRRGTARIGR